MLRNLLLFLFEFTQNALNLAIFLLLIFLTGYIVTVSLNRAY